MDSSGAVDLDRLGNTPLNSDLDYSQHRQPTNFNFFFTVNKFIY